MGPPRASLALLIFSRLLLLCAARDEEEVARRLPTDAPLKNVKELEMGVERVLQVRRNDDLLYVIRMPTKNQPLHLYITPCNRPVHWQLRIPNQFELEPNTHPRSEHFNHILHMRIPPLIEFSEDLQARERLIILAGEENEKRMKFYASSIEADYVVLNMSASRESTVKVFASTLKSQLEHFYPPLPKDATVVFSLNESAASSDFDSIDLHLKWPIPGYLEDGSEDAARYRFCVLTSRHQPQYSICEKSSGDLDSMHCVAANINELTLKGLRPAERYYVTVFVHNTITGGSAAYPPVEFRTPSQKKNPKELVLSDHGVSLENLQILKDGTLMKHQVEGPKHASNNYLYRMPADDDQPRNVEIAVHACNGYVRLAIHRNGHMLRKTRDFIGLQQFIVSASRRDQLHVQVINDDEEQEVGYWIWASINPGNSPFLELPADRSVRVLRRYCNRAVLQFIRTAEDANVRYCVHEKKTRTDYFKDVINEPTQMCWSELPVGRQAICFRHNESEPLGSVHDSLRGFPGQPMQATVDGLQPSTTYRLDVSAQKIDGANSQPLPYRTVFVRTLDHC